VELHPIHLITDEEAETTELSGEQKHYGWSREHQKKLKKHHHHIPKKSVFGAVEERSGLISVKDFVSLFKTL